MPRTAPAHDQLSRRERQIMDLVWRTGSATAADILAALPDPPSYSAVRALLAVLVETRHPPAIISGYFGPRLVRRLALALAALAGHHASPARRRTRALLPLLAFAALLALPAHGFSHGPQLALTIPSARAALPPGPLPTA